MTMDRNTRFGDFVSPLVKTTMEFGEWRKLVQRQPVVFSGWVVAQFRKQFFATEKSQFFLELRYTTLVFYHLASADGKSELYSFPLEYTRVTCDDETGTITCTYTDKMSVSFQSRVESYKCWRESILGATELQGISLKDFSVQHLIGKGATSDVYLAVEMSTGRKVAMKIMKKSRVSDSDKALRRLINERLLLELLHDFPFVLDLHSAFQTTQDLYIVTDYCEGGDLDKYLKRRNYSLELWQVQRITAEIVLTLEMLHKHGIIYRDLKPENVLLDGNGHVRLADFGLSKMLSREDMDLTSSFCGTLGYIAPEIVDGKQYGVAVDKWALGSLLFVLLVGRTPYYTKSRENYFRAVRKGRILFPEKVPQDAQDLIRGLMHNDPLERLSLDDVKIHPFFTGFDWRRAMLREPVKERSMYEPGEIERMNATMSQKVGNGKAMRNNKSKDDNSWWESRLPKVMSSILLGEKKASRSPSIPGFLYAYSGKEPSTCNVPPDRSFIPESTSQSH